jgi:hypothetical protein
MSSKKQSALWQLLAAQGSDGLFDPALARLGLLGRFDPECILALMAVAKRPVSIQHAGPLVGGSLRPLEVTTSTLSFCRIPSTIVSSSIALQERREGRGKRSRRKGRSHMNKINVVLSCIFLAVLSAVLIGDSGINARALAQDNVIHFTKPAEGQKFPIGYKVPIAWDKNSVSDSKLTLRLHKAQTGEEMSGAFQVSNTGFYDLWEVGVDDVLGMFYFRLTNYAKTKSGRSGNFEFVPGVIGVNSPNSGQQVTVNTPCSIEWDKNALNAFKYYATVFLQVYSMKLQAAGGGYPVANSGVYSWTPTSYDIGQNKILVTTADGKFKGESGVFKVVLPFIPKTFKKKG